MSSGNRGVSVCICTYRRPASFLLTLETCLVALQRFGGHGEIIVVDSDPDGSACGVVRARGTAGIVKYRTAKRPGVAAARNCALEFASHDLIAFIDDDEWCDPEWLVKLVTALEGTESAAVFGPVISVPDVESSVLPRRSRPLTGTVMDWRDCRTGNVLFSKALVDLIGQFDEERGTAGGEDTQFFARAQKAGAELSWCDEALVWERLPVERTTRRYRLSRAYAGGRTYVLNVATVFGLAALSRVAIRLMLAVVARPLVLGFAWRGGDGFGVAIQIAGDLGKIAGLPEALKRATVNRQALRQWRRTECAG
jgi:glycosyltransferase involved in cell wall biosynthesis